LTQGQLRAALSSLEVFTGDQGDTMFNIVKRRDFMLADDLPTLSEADQLRLEKYGREYVVVTRAGSEPKAATEKPILG
jgi:hypothetical protein